MSSSSSSPTSSSSSSFSISRLLLDIVRVAGPTIVLQICNFLPFTLTTMHLGSFTSSYVLNHVPFVDDAASASRSSLSQVLLSAFALSNLTGAVTCIMIMIGVLSASDTLGPQYFALAPHKVGILALRGFVVCFIAILLLVVTWFIPSSTPSSLHPSTNLPLIGAALAYFSQPVSIVSLSAVYLKRYSLALLPLLVFQVAQRFLTCQSVVSPLLPPSLLAACVLHPLMLQALVTLPGTGDEAYARNSEGDYNEVLFGIAEHGERRRFLICWWW